jgi:isopenicillin N synthase-like dioxygenase
MSYAQAQHIDVAAIPVIDVASLQHGDSQAVAAVAAQLRAAAGQVGFFYIRNHGVAQSLIDEVAVLARRFFALPPEQKQRVKINQHHRGFLRIGEAKMYDNARPDFKESYVFGREVAEDDPDYLAGRPMVYPCHWPDFMPELRTTLNVYFAAAQACGERLLQAFAVSLGIAEDYFLRSIDKPVSRGSLVYYPPQPAELGEQQFGVAPHTDYGCLTLVCQDDTGGLQVRRKGGDWVTAHPIDGTFVVNVGDLLARWSNNRFVSTPHRVINASGRERYSYALFIDPNWDTLIEPVVTGPDEQPLYEPVRCADYIIGRLNKSFDYRKKNEG